MQMAVAKGRRRFPLLSPPVYSPIYGGFFI